MLCNGNGQLEIIYGGKRQKINLKSPNLDAFLDQIKLAKKPQYLVIGVRPSAFVDFESVRSKAESRRLLIGYELEPGLKVLVPESDNFADTQKEI